MHMKVHYIHIAEPCPDPYDYSPQTRTVFQKLSLVLSSHLHVRGASRK